MEDCGDGIGALDGRLANTCPKGLVDGGGDIISSSEQLSDSQSLPWASLAQACSSHDAADGEPPPGFVFFELTTLGCRRAYCPSGGVVFGGTKLFGTSVMGARSKSCDNNVGTLIRGGDRENAISVEYQSGSFVFVISRCCCKRFKDGPCSCFVCLCSYQRKIVRFSLCGGECEMSTERQRKFLHCTTVRPTMVDKSDGKKSLIRKEATNLRT